MKYFLLHLGCQMNTSDAERIETVLNEMGLEKTEQEEEANLLGIVACSVRQRAIDRVYGRIHKWNKAKNRRNIITFVSGCILDEDEKKFLKLFDFLFRMPDLPKLPEIIRQYGVTTPITGYNFSEEDDPADFWRIDASYNSSFQAFVPIQNGCNKFCSYCAVPYTRGREVSRPSEEILNEVESLIQKDFRTITLLGQNVNSYGLDKKGKEIDFASLLEKIALKIEASDKKAWVYFTSPHASDMKRRVFEVMAEHDCLAKQVHLPMQSGDDEILQAMNRSYNTEKFRTIIGWIRELMPEATIFTDIIVGFPGETEEQLENTRKTMQEFAFNMAYIALYSPRPGAASASLADIISPEIKKRRLHILSDEFKKSAFAWNKQLIGKTVTVLVEGRHARNKKLLSARTEGMILVQFESEDLSLIGQFVEVTIDKANPLALAATLQSK